MEKIRLKELQEGDFGTGIFMLSACMKAVTKTNKNYYKLTVQENSGEISGNVWNADSEPELKTGDFVSASFKVDSYNGQPQIVLSNITVLEPESVDKSEFRRVSRFSTELMWEQLKGKYLDEVRNEWLGKLLDTYVQDPDFIASFKQAPGAVRVHHNYAGGLLQHTLFVVKNAVKISASYGNQYPIDRDVLITIAFLHDLGKMQEIQGDLAYEYSDLGITMGHVSIGAMDIYHRCSNIDGFPAELRNLLCHCILAHHGKLEYGSPVVPAHLEAVILNLADGIDATMEEMIVASSEHEREYNRYLGTNPLKTNSAVWQTGNTEVQNA